MSHPSDDLILESVGAADGPPRLIQIARAITLPGEDEAATGYLWSTGRLSASREGDRVRIRRSRSGYSHLPLADRVEAVPLAALAEPGSLLPG